MTDAVACWLRGGWDLSFLDPDCVRFDGSIVDDQCQHPNGTVWRHNSLALIVRRSRKHSYCEISPLPVHGKLTGPELEKAEPRTDSERRLLEEDEVNGAGSLSKDPVYENQPTACDVLCGGGVVHAPPLVPRRTLTSPSSVYTNIPHIPRAASLTFPSVQRLHAAARTDARSPPPPPPPPPPPSSEGSSSSSSADDRFLLLQPPAAVCRVSASPAADDSSAFSYNRDAEAFATAAPQPGGPDSSSHWRSTKCFATWDQELLTKTFRRLSLSNFYLGKLSFSDAKLILRHCSVGTFLLRDSSDERFPFSLSVQTSRGATSIRIIYESGYFRLDSEQEQVHLMPTFDCVIRLIQFYVHQTMGAGDNNCQRSKPQNNFVLLQMNGQRDIPVLLRKPFEHGCPSLAHLCRKRINGILNGNSVNRLPSIPSLKAFLNDYPYDV